MAFIGMNQDLHCHIILSVSYTHLMAVDDINLEYWDHFHYTMCFNATGHPALTIPLGLNEDKLPVAVQIVGPMFSEQRLIHFARLIQSLHEGFIPPQ